MRLLILYCLVAVIEAGFFDFLTGGNHEQVHEISPDPGEIGGARKNPNLGDEIHIPRGSSENPNAGAEIHIPSNRVPVQPVPPTTTHTPFSTTFEPTTTLRRFLPSPNEFNPTGKDCPSRADAFCSGSKYSYLFYGNKVYSILGDRVVSSNRIDELFPSGPNSVNAAVYDVENEIVVLVHERSVYGYKVIGANTMRLDSSYPKELPSAVFTPNGAMRWHDKRQMLLSNGGKFALYDENWNKSLMTGRINDYFKGLPDNVRGVSRWEDGQAKVYTKNLVFTYNVANTGVAGDGIPIAAFFKCQ
ncbi:unnamed protein product [Cylicocyclus nassatus]|uniref:Uncharacterized protein n=1 Tax=Cylicocyclus nassatus TaxID=53992 RepID=A0AA36DNX6_CYLNA|nr:unnamed protein product [Cylicocyclus nassatus]